jgi:uncharacterized protein involved in exopolysaccharide biosynthesis
MSPTLDQLDQSVQTEPVRDGHAALGPRSSELRSFPAAGTRPSVFRLEVLRSIGLHRRLVAGFVLAGILLSAAYLLEVWPTYFAQSVVYVQPASPPVLDQGGGARWPFDSGSYESYMQQQMLNVTRTDVLSAALHKLGHGRWWNSNQSEQVAIERLRRTMEVTRQGNSYQFSIGVRASSAQTAAQVANAVTASYIDSATGQQKAGDAERLAALRGERDRVQKELAADRTEQQTLNKQLGQAAVGASAPDHYDDDIDRVRTELAKARTDHDEAVARYTSLGDGNGLTSASLNAEAEELISTDAGLVSMKAALNQRRAALIAQMAALTPSDSGYVQDNGELAKINGSLEAMANDLRAKAAERIQLRLRADLERTADVESQLNAQLGQLTAEAGDATSKLQRSSDLVTDIARLQTRFTSVDEQWHNLMLEDGVLGSVALATPAVAPPHMADSDAPRNALAIILAGILLGVLAAVIANKLDPRIYVAADVERVLGLAPLAQLPHFYEVSEGVVEEQLLRLSATLEYARKLGSVKSCVFTGSGPGVGVTTVVTRVRGMLEAMGRATVLVDASGIPPSPTSANPSIGLGERMARGMVATQRGSRPSALVRQMALETETRADSIVLTDTAPLVISAETEYLARFVDGAIVVLESGVTTRSQLRDLTATLHRLDLPSVGFVLNRVELRTADKAFRQSIQAIEQHLNPQNRSYTRRTVRSQAVPTEAAPARSEAQEKVVEPGVGPADTQASTVQVPLVDLPSKPQERAQSPVVSEQLHVPTEPSRFPPRTTRMPLAAKAAPTAAAPVEGEPWWLADLYRGNDVRQSKPVVEEAKVAEPEAEAVSTPAEVPVPEPVESAQETSPVEVVEAAATETPVAASEVVAPAIETTVAAPEADWTPPAQSWESLTAIADAAKHEVATSEEAKVEMPEPITEPEQPRTLEQTVVPELATVSEQPEAREKAGEAKQTEPVTASRFDGLRNLINVMGLEKIRKAAAQRAPLSEQAAQTNQEAARALFAALKTTARDSAAGPAASELPQQLTGQESLPFPPAIDSAEIVGDGENLPLASGERKPVQEETGLLPFRKGQYKQK